MTNTNIIGKRFYATTKKDEFPELVKAIKICRKEDDNIEVILENVYDNNKQYSFDIKDLYANYNSIKPIAVLSLRLVMNRIYGNNIILTVNPYDIYESTYTKLKSDYVLYSRYLEENLFNKDNEFPTLTKLNKNNSKIYLDKYNCCSLISEDYKTHFNSNFIYDKRIIFLYLDDDIDDIIKILQYNNLDKLEQMLKNDNEYNLNGIISLETYIKSFSNAIYSMLGISKCNYTKNEIINKFKEFQYKAVNNNLILTTEDKYILCDIQYHNNIIDCENILYNYDLSPNLQIDYKEIDFKTIQIKEFEYEDDLDKIFKAVENKKYVVIVIKTTDNHILLVKYYTKKIEDEILEDDYDENVMTKDEVNKFLSIIGSK